ncbi:MAG: DNA polymerase III subunit [Candidatus Omnitrophica bacterium]|nr:DNA polymerase III subunit [Candidatus Omnitrophota bacterium]
MFLSELELNQSLIHALGNSKSLLFLCEDIDVLTHKAKKLAKQINCLLVLEGAAVDSCGQCGPCQMIEKGEYPDFILVQAQAGSASIKIEDIRRLKERIYLKPFQSKKKIIIVQEAERLTVESANALLKILEEPPDDASIILLAQSISRLLPTVVSRCRQVRFPKKDFLQGNDDYQARIDLASRFFEIEDLIQADLLCEDISVLERSEIDSILLEVLSILRDILMLNLGLKEAGFRASAHIDLALRWKDVFGCDSLEYLMEALLQVREYVSKNANIKLSMDFLLKIIVREKQK